VGGRRGKTQGGWGAGISSNRPGGRMGTKRADSGSTRGPINVRDGDGRGPPGGRSVFPLSVGEKTCHVLEQKKKKGRRASAGQLTVTAGVLILRGLVVFWKSEGFSVVAAYSQEVCGKGEAGPGVGR